jgi:hypothetical protein
MIGPDGSGIAFVLTTPRSGSTLLGAILGSHSQVACPPEPWFLLPILGVPDQRLEAVAPYDHELARRATCDFVDDSLYSEASVAFAVTVYNRRLEKAGKNVFIDKGTRYFHVTQHLREMFPHAVYIWLRRNPLDVIASYKSTWNTNISELFGPVYTPNSFDVVASFDILSKHFRSVDKKHILNYEDLVLKPDDVVKDLCSTLGLEFEERMLSYFLNDELMSAYRMSEFGDRKIHTETSIHSRSVGAWRDVLTVDEVAMTLDVLGSDPFTVMGYDDVMLEALALTGRARTAISTSGRRAEYVAALAEYPECNARALLDDPSLWPRASGFTSPATLERVFRASIHEKEAMIEGLAGEAEARLSLLRESEASLSKLRQALRERDESVRSITAEAEHRLNLLNAAEAARARLDRELHEAHQSLEEKEELRRRITTEAERRLEMLNATEAARTQFEQEVHEAHRSLEQKEELLRRITTEAARRLETLDAARTSLAQAGQNLLEAHQALEEKEAVLGALHTEAELRLQLLQQSDAERRLLAQELARRPAPGGE